MSAEDMENTETKVVEEEIVEAVEDEGIELDDNKLPFPNATVVRLMRKNLDKHKQIKGIVKKEMNLFLGRLVETVCKKMNAYEYSSVDYGMFKQAVETFENIQSIELEKIRIIKNLEKIKAECDILIDDVERKFHE
jgi:histone H3/H4